MTMRGKWKPEYPGQSEPAWTWWDRDEHEDDLLGFHTKADRDRFGAGKPGPFRRRLCKPGQQPISQLEDWKGMIHRLAGEAP